MGGSWSAWAVHRLRGVGLVRLGGAALHILESWVVMRQAVGADAAHAFALANIAAVIGGAWWGATEVLRDDLRASRDAARADALTARWLSWASRAALMMLVLAGIVGIVGTQNTHDSLPALWAGLAFLRLGADLPIRVWHARIYAYRRVYRSPWIQLGIESIGPVAAWLLADIFGPAGVLLALLLSSVAARVYTLHVVGKAMAADHLTWVRPRLKPRKSRVALPPMRWRQFFWFGIAGAANRLPSFIVALVLVTTQAPVNIAIGLHLTLGVLTIATAWPWTHYHDIVPLEAPLLARIRRFVEGRIMRESIVVGLLTATLAALVMALLTPTDLRFVPAEGILVLRAPRQPEPWPWALGPATLGLGFSVLASAHIIAWRRGRTGILAMSTVLVIAVAVAAPTIALALVPRGRFESIMPAARMLIEHACIGAAAILAAAWTWFASRNQAVAVPTGRIDWMEAVADMRRDAGPWVAIELDRGGAIAEAALQRIADGSERCARHHRHLVIKGLELQLVRRRAIATGWATSVTRAMAPAKPRPHPTELAIDVRFDSNGRREVLVIGPDGLRTAMTTAKERHAAWRAVTMWLRHGGRTREARVTDWDIEAGVLNHVVVRVRPEGERSPKELPPSVPA